MSFELERRRFLKMTGGAAALGAAPAVSGLLARPSLAAPVGADPRGNHSIVTQGLLRADRNGKPLLVVLAPASERQRREHGELWAHCLASAGTELKADLVLCEVVCASARELHDATAIECDSRALAALVETDGSTPCGAIVDGSDLPSPGPRSYGLNFHLQALRDRNRILGERLHGVIAPNADVLSRRLDQALAALEHAEKRTPGAGSHRLEEVDRAAAVVRWRAERDVRQRSRYFEVLGEALDERLSTGPAGARWRRRGELGPQERAFVLDPERSALELGTIA